MTDLEFRTASIDDVPQLASMNQRLIRDEGHTNPMTLDQLRERMGDWLQGTYEGIIAEIGGRPAGYLLFRREPGFVYVRHLFVDREFRRRGIGRKLLRWLERSVLAEPRELRVDALLKNEAGLAFWRAVGFHDYCVTLTKPRPRGPES
ncbi:MAG: GNAT family N-acetyltransferase [Planctomyces sp.]|nr:GNAT family N-acetyltransferase [Planctomyces sp.]